MKPSLQIRILLLSFLSALWVSAWGDFVQFIALLVVFFMIFLGIGKKYFFCMVALFFISGYFYGSIYNSSENPLIPFFHQDVRIEGQVKNYSNQKNRVKENHIKVISIDGKPIKTNILLSHKSENSFFPGQKITFQGIIKPIESWNDFDYEAYLWEFGIGAKIGNPQIITIKSPPWFSPYTFSSWIRESLSRNIKKHLPSPHSPIAIGMTFGAKEKLPPSTQTAIKNSGLQHLIVVSGSNVMIVMIFLALLFRKFGPWVLCFFSSLGIILFWLIAGSDPPVNRAVIFAGMGLLVLLNGRLIDYRNLLLVAAFIIAIINPITFQQSLSFWLSFMAMFGILMVMPLWWKYTQNWMPKTLSLILGTVICAQISVLPLILLYFETFPSIGILSNIIVEPLVPIIMINTFLLGIFGSVPFLGSLIGFIDFLWIEILYRGALFLSSYGVIRLPYFLIYGIFGIQILFFFWSFLSPLYEKKFLNPFLSQLDLLSKNKDNLDKK